VAERHQQRHDPDQRLEPRVADQVAGDGTGGEDDHDRGEAADQHRHADPDAQRA
jgi:hypothetical protein